MFEVLAQHPGAFDQQVAIGFAVVRELLTCIVNDLHVNAENRTALLHTDFHLRIGRQSQVLVFECAQRTQRTHLGHAPGVKHVHLVVIAEGVDHGWRAGRAANHSPCQVRELQTLRLHVAQKHLPDCGYACCKGNAFGFNQFVNRLAVQSGAWEHQFGAGHGCAVRYAPSIDVEHGHHRQDRITCRNGHHIGQGRRECMQYG